ncbi:MAG: sensor histidine kinase [Candidatus Kapabacteria bacterium]|nr:sensor histidine kinase [Candidatus Kapabacteria bacterium]
MECLQVHGHSISVYEIVRERYAQQFRPLQERYRSGDAGSIWLRLCLKNITTVPMDRVFSIGSILIDSAMLYELKNSHIVRAQFSGGMVQKEQRELSGYNTAFWIRLQPLEEQTLYVHIVGRTIPFILHCELLSYNVFLERQCMHERYNSIVWGMIMCVILLSVVQYSTTRNILYGVFALHALASLGAMLSVQGVLQQWLTILGAEVRWREAIVAVAVVLSVVYTRFFLSLRALWAQRVLDATLVVYAVLTILSAIGMMTILHISIATMVVIGVMVGIALGLVRSNSLLGIMSVIVFASGWIVCGASLGVVIVILLSNESMLASNGIEYILVIGSVGAGVQIVMAAIALILRIVEVEQEFVAVQQERAYHMLKNRELVEANEAIRRQAQQLEEQAQSLRIANAEMEKIAQELIEQRALLQRKNEELDAANQEKSEILSIAAHDLKNPLTGLKGIIEILRSGDSFKPSYLQQMSLTMQQSVDRMFSIVQNLLDMQALEEGVIKPQYETFDMVLAIKTLIDSYRVPAAKKLITIDFKANASEVPCFADKQLVVQIADNLISNALKYSPSRTTVSIRTLLFTGFDELCRYAERYRVQEMEHVSRFDPNSPIIVLIVQDEGPGFTEEDKARLFHKFARLSARPTGGEHSTGLGLSITKRLVESMHGVIWCESMHLHGARFIVAFGTTIA